MDNELTDISIDLDYFCTIFNKACKVFDVEIGFSEEFLYKIKEFNYKYPKNESGKEYSIIARKGDTGAELPITFSVLRTVKDEFREFVATICLRLLSDIWKKEKDTTFTLITKDYQKKYIV